METFENNNSIETTLAKEVSAILFVSTKPVPLEKLTELFKNNSEDEISSALSEVKTKIDEMDLGFELLTIGDSYQLRSRPELASTIQKLITPKMKRLSKAAAETLAVVAYKQPVSKAEIEAIRGVDALPTIKTLLDAKLIRVIGREDTPGSPALYGTTPYFLEKFGLTDLSHLPTVREITELDSEVGSEIASELDSETNSEEEDSEVSQNLSSELEVSDTEESEFEDSSDIEITEENRDTEDAINV